MLKKILTGLLFAGAMVVVLAGCSSAPAKTDSAPATNSAATADLDKRLKTVEDFIKVQQDAINPGLGTVMIEYSQRMAKAWFAGEAQAWDEAHYQILEMTEIQETGEITRPKRADALKTFESKYLDPLDKSIKAKDKAAFEDAYKKAVDGCNACHAATKSDDFPNGYGWVKFTIPTASPVTYQDLGAK